MPDKVIKACHKAELHMRRQEHSGPDRQAQAAHLPGQRCTQVLFGSRKFFYRGSRVESTEAQECLQLPKGTPGRTHLFNTVQCCGMQRGRCGDIETKIPSARCLQCAVLGAGGDAPDHPASLHSLLVQHVWLVIQKNATRLAKWSGHAACSSKLPGCSWKPGMRRHAVSCLDTLFTQSCGCLHVKRHAMRTPASIDR